jgi:hypothetical protein
VVLLPHAQDVLGLSSGGIRRVAQALGFSGDYAAARNLCALVANTLQGSGDYGPKHPSTLAVRSNLAHWTRRRGVPLTRANGPEMTAPAADMIGARVERQRQLPHALQRSNV